MKIKVFKINNQAYAQIKCLTGDIDKYIIRKSWDKTYNEEVKIIGKELINDNILLYKKEYDLLEVRLPLLSEPMYDDFYFIDLCFIDGHIETVYIDYSKYNNIKLNGRLYYHIFKEEIFINDPITAYTVFLKGNYNDIHKCELYYVENSRKIIFKVPIEEYISKNYQIIVKKNNEIIAKENMAIITTEKLDFIIYPEFLVNDYVNIIVKEKYNYALLKDIKISFKDYTLYKDKTFDEIKYTVSPINIAENNIIKIDYKMIETTLEPSEKQLSSTYILNPFRQFQEVINISHKYYPEKDTCKIYWNSNFSENITYRIIIDNEIIYTKSNHVTINNFKKHNYGAKTILCELSVGSSNLFIKKITYEIPNYHKIYLSNKFIPIIDYSKCMNVNDKIGVLKWTKPSFKYSSKIKINVSFVKNFLDEFINIWDKNYILEKPVEEFDKKYIDYNKQYEYDFKNNDFIPAKTPNESVISYDGENNGFIDLGETNIYQLPLWFCKPGKKYNVTIEIYDFWGKFVGSNTVEFGLYNNYTGDISLDWINFDRNQEIMFGETGTVGEFYKINSPSPIDVMHSYSTKYKTYNGKPLYNVLNIDNNNDSLFFYFYNQHNDFQIRYMRLYNFVEFKYALYNNDNDVPILEASHIPKSNNYDKNLIKISKENFKEGINKLEIKTVNYDGTGAKAKSFIFHVLTEKPKAPYIKIKNEDYSLIEDKIVINKKYFQMSVLNNEQSKKYAGWIYKEVHFFFKTDTATYNEYPDYVVIASPDDGSIVLNNTVGIENGHYFCKAIAYDYHGNPSEPWEIEFDLIAELKIETDKIFVNNLDEQFIWHIKKPQDCEGVIYYIRYSSDGKNFFESIPTKLESKYYINDNSTNENVDLQLHWLTTEDGTYKQGLYQLVAYEYNYKHPNGIDKYKFYSPIIDVAKTSKPSNPIYAEETEQNKIVNVKKYNEFSYTNDINSIVFSTIHSEEVIDNPSTSEIEGQRYQIELISPNGANKYKADLEPPTEIGIYKFTNILTKCNVTDPEEGVWTLKFITIDKYGNTNAHRGYYTYEIVFVNRNPKISSITSINGNGTDIFGLSSSNIGYILNTSEIYSNISNFSKHKEKFQINNYKVKINYTPSNTSYELNIFSNNNTINVQNPLTEKDKLSHLRDGKYSISIICYDLLNRASSAIDKVFFINTKLTGELNFISEKIYTYNNINIVAIANEDINKIYYTFDENANNGEYKSWKFINVSDFEYHEHAIHGIYIKNVVFEKDGPKTMKYVIEEESSNTTEVRTHSFIIDTETKMLPLFDYTNKIYYTSADSNIHISWNNTDKDVDHFYYKLDKIIMRQDGTIEVIESFMPSVITETIREIIPVGALKNGFVDIGSKREINIPLSRASWILSGYYQLTIKGISKYNTTETNTFKFQVDKTTQLDIGYEIINNKITLNNNVISWNHIKDASYYEISYDMNNWIKVIDNRFLVNSDKVIIDQYGKTYLYMRWRSYNGIYSEVSKIEILLNINKLKTPKVCFFENRLITDNNKKIQWTIEVEDIPLAKYIYYSFDNEIWLSKKINNSKINIIDDRYEYPIKDDRYNIYVMTTDGDPLNEKYINKSNIAYAFVDIYAEEIEKPRFVGIENGKVFNIPVKLIIENKNPNVQYYIFVNDKLVNEGFEIYSYELLKYNIIVKAKKKGLENVFTLISENDNFHILSKIDEKYTINIGNEKVICYIDPENELIQIESMPNKREQEIILYKEKNKDTKWNILVIGKTLDLNKEWEFKISTFEFI